MSYGTTYQVEIHEPDITITSTMIRWAVIHLIEKENPGAKITHSSIPADDEYAVSVYLVARNERGSKSELQYHCNECGATPPPGASTVEGRWHESSCSLRTDNQEVQ